MPVRREAEFVLKKEVKYPAETWDLIVDLLNWNRVLLEAHSRHLELDHGLDESEYNLEYYICGECIAEALKCHSTYPNWERKE